MHPTLNPTTVTRMSNPQHNLHTRSLSLALSRCLSRAHARVLSLSLPTPGDEPYYEAASSFEQACKATFKCKVGAAPGPQLAARAATKKRQGAIWGSFVEM